MKKDMDARITMENFKPRFLSFLLVTVFALTVSLSGSAQEYTMDAANSGAEANMMGAASPLGLETFNLGSGPSLTEDRMADLKSLGLLALYQTPEGMENQNPTLRVLERIAPSSLGQQRLLGGALGSNRDLKEKLDKAMLTQDPKDVDAAVQAVDAIFKTNAVAEKVNARAEAIINNQKKLSEYGNLSDEQNQELQKEAEALLPFVHMPDCRESITKLQILAARYRVAQIADSAELAKRAGLFVEFVGSTNAGKHAAMSSGEDIPASPLKPAEFGADSRRTANNPSRVPALAETNADSYAQKATIGEIIAIKSAHEMARTGDPNAPETAAARESIRGLIGKSFWVDGTIRIEAEEVKDGKWTDVFYLEGNGEKIEFWRAPPRSKALVDQYLKDSYFQNRFVHATFTLSDPEENSVAFRIDFSSLKPASASRTILSRLGRLTAKLGAVFAALFGLAGSASAQTVPLILRGHDGYMALSPTLVHAIGAVVASVSAALPLLGLFALAAIAGMAITYLALLHDNPKLIREFKHDFKQMRVGDRIVLALFYFAVILLIASVIIFGIHLITGLP